MSAPPNAAAVLALLRQFSQFPDGPDVIVDDTDEEEIDYPLCGRGRHEMSPDNVGVNGRCMACKREYNRVTRAGLPWDGPTRQRKRRRSCSRTRAATLSPTVLRNLRALVGACVECGWTPDLAHGHPCEAGVGSAGRGSEEARPA